MISRSMAKRVAIQSAGEPNVEPRVAAMLDAALDVGLPIKVAAWRASLQELFITPEMRAVFVALGWLVPHTDEEAPGG